MRIADTLLPELDHEMATTRSLLERVPESNPGWKPHPKSCSMGQLAMHIAKERVPARERRSAAHDLRPDCGHTVVNPVAA